MIIEQNTNYAYRLQHMDNPTFEKVRDLSVEFYRSLPQELQDELFDALNRGVDVLDSEPQMTAYMFSYGKMHQAKLKYAYSQLPIEFLEKDEVNIIDYGCGQALGTMCYADFLRDNGYSQKIKTITLIEPSELCLKRAALHASLFFPNAIIRAINKGFDDLAHNDIICSENIPTLHILSNVLDIATFDLYKFSSLVGNCIKGECQFVCVGPKFGISNKDNRLIRFTKMFNSEFYYTKTFKKGELHEEKNWTGIIKCFANTKYEDFGKELLSSGKIADYLHHSVVKIKHYEESINKYPNNALLYYSTAKTCQQYALSLKIILNRLKDTTELQNMVSSMLKLSLNHYIKSINLNPDFCHCYCNAGQTLLEMGDPNRALTFVLNGVKKKPSCSKGWTKLGEVYLKLHDYTNAKNSFDKAIEIDPMNVDAKSALIKYSDLLLPF